MSLILISLLLVSLVRETTNKIHTQECLSNFNTFKDYSDAASHKKDKTNQIS